jgi:hypothetical protein
LRTLPISAGFCEKWNYVEVISSFVPSRLIVRRSNAIR